MVVGPILNHICPFFLHLLYLLCLVCLYTSGSPFTSYIGFPVHWVFAPSHHGKGECDFHGAIVKKSIKLFVLNGS